MRYGELGRKERYKEPNPTGLFDGAYKYAADGGTKYPERQTQNPLGYRYTPQKTPKASNPSGGYGAPAANPNQPYIDQLNSLYDQVMGRGKFQYDLNGDMLYKQMADQYTQLGRQAMRDATGTAAGLTGGYGNSWANQVGNQAYQQFLTQLNNNIPELYDRAYNVWLNEGSELLQQYELAANHKAVLDSLAPRTGGGGQTPANQAKSGKGTEPKADQTSPVNAALLADLAMSGAAAGSIMSDPFAGYYQAVLEELGKTKK